VRVEPLGDLQVFLATASAVAQDVCGLVGWGAMSHHLPLTTRVFLGGAGVVAALSGAMILVSVVASVAEHLGLGLRLDLYKELVRKPLVRLILGTDVDLPWTSVGLDACALWLSLFVVVNVFVYRKEGVLLWGHIRKNYCGRESASLLGSGLCTLVRYGAAFAATPFACARIFGASLRSEQTVFTSCYITVEPGEIAQYLKVLGWVIAALVAFLALLSRYL
jgi:hypothetical protein